MPAATYHKLNNPAWFSLSEAHRHFAIGNEEIKLYQHSIAPFVACVSNKENVLNGLDEWISPGNSFFIIGELPRLPANYITENMLLCVQMVCTTIINIPAAAVIEELNETDDAQMVSLINQVQPGYYKPGTRLMGDYYGIRNNSELVAITGERMRMNGFTEISAVVTHPQFTGRKYAQQLVAHAANKNIEAGTTPFLHVAETNERAVKLYEYLGFVQRRIIAFWKIKREG